MTALTFKKAVKLEARLRLAIAGPSGSGKTYTSLTVGKHLANGGSIALVDSEDGSASKYADIFEFDVLELAPPFHPLRFVESINAAAQAGYDVLILDSLSHAWNGPGGVLELVEQFSKKYKGNSYAAWGDATPLQNKLIEAIIAAPLHILATMRSKQDYILTEKNGKQIPQKVGMAPIQRDGFEYEFDVFLDMDLENNAIVSKTRCPALTGLVLPKPGEELAQTLSDWLGGVPVELSKNGSTLPDVLNESALSAATLQDFAQSVSILFPVAFDNAAQVTKAYEYMFGEFSAEKREAALIALDIYANVLADGAGKRAAVRASKSKYQELLSWYEEEE